MNTDAIDQSALQQLIDDIGPAVVELIGHFITDIRGKMDDLSAVSDEPDISTLTIHAHSLKGLSRTIGMIGISDIAFDLEKACRDDNREQAMTHFATISTRIDAAIEALTVFVEKHSVNQES